MWMKVIQKVSTIFFPPTIAFEMEGCRCSTPQRSIPASQHTFSISPRALWCHQRKKLDCKFRASHAPFPSSRLQLKVDDLWEPPLEVETNGSPKVYSTDCAGWSWTLSSWWVSLVWAAVWSQVYIALQDKNTLRQSSRDFVRNTHRHDTALSSIKHKNVCTRKFQHLPPTEN